MTAVRSALLALLLVAPAAADVRFGVQMAPEASFEEERAARLGEAL